MHACARMRRWKVKRHTWLSHCIIKYSFQRRTCGGDADVVVGQDDARLWELASAMQLADATTSRIASVSCQCSRDSVMSDGDAWDEQGELCHRFMQVSLDLELGGPAGHQLPAMQPKVNMD